jgi:anti-sigma factor RsiW
MTCREVLDFVMAYLDGELTADVRSEFERHLTVCPQCVDYLNSYRATVELEQQAFPPREGDAARRPVPEDLVKAILASRKR